MQDVRVPNNKLEAFEMWKDSWRADLISMLSSSKRIPVRYVIPVKDESEETILDPCTQYGAVKKTILTPRVEEPFADDEADMSGASYDEWGGR